MDSIIQAFYHAITKYHQAPLSSLQWNIFTRRLCERQTESGGLNGRPEKLQDVCYSWWCLSALSILGRLSWIDQEALARFILNCQVCLHFKM